MASFLILQHDGSDDPLALRTVGVSSGEYKASEGERAARDVIRASAVAVGGTVVAVRYDNRKVMQPVNNPDVEALPKDYLEKLGK